MFNNFNWIHDSNNSQYLLVKLADIQIQLIIILWENLQQRHVNCHNQYKDNRITTLNANNQFHFFYISTTIINSLTNYSWISEIHFSSPINPSMHCHVKWLMIETSGLSNLGMSNNFFQEKWCNIKRKWGILWEKHCMIVTLKYRNINTQALNYCFSHG